MMVIWFCLLITLIITKGSSDLLQYNCVNKTSYTPNSTYKTNLHSLLSNLHSNATRDTGFYHTTVDTVHGMFLCRGDVSTDVCGGCVGDARNRILDLCTNEKTAIIWYDNCMLRYSEKSMLGMVDQSAWLAWRNKENDSQPNGYMRLVGNMLDQITTRASLSSGSGKKFAVLEANFSPFERVYALGQCTPDLSKVDCQICFRNVIAMLPGCCYGAVGGRAVFPSCNVRYELYPFYNLSAVAAPPAPPLTNPPPPSPPPPPTMLANSGSSKGNKRKVTIAASVVSITGTLVFLLCFYFLKVKRAKKSHCNERGTTTGTSEIEPEQSVQYDFSIIEAITNCFSPNNKIGEDGYGTIYKGRHPNGSKVEVKRLSRSLTKGDVDFKNEIALVAKLHHRNLVRLLGFCLQREEKILIYEFISNKSLDYFLFEKKQQLNWPTRYKIIGGIARGLLYLHEDSGFKIIHHDLKASNVLLDGDMNPKISNSGLASIFKVDQIQRNTSKAIRTRGYMSSKYALHGLLSMKSDVFSFGVLLLEIITGKKNSSLSMKSTKAQDLWSYAWKHWREDRALEMVDQSLGGLYSRDEVIQCIHVGLLCVQDEVDDRPTMANVVLMLNSHSVTRRTPNPPLKLAS
ncbi:PREDICTED: cysteine-rich receptor-like protein kinase 25 [Ipomoea nil]|uniref:cysteine-rich receptor-like protein kinase 25 n=1 Tax=Ipomoea nil TaxID=35883 RepID=UPI00090107F0|nr:PREDICTED: cysteine-rich receptor-like protein kinase 25 [Ipomoea nil]